MKNLLLPLISTRSGWVFRQILKGVTVVSASLSTWLLAQGVDGGTTAAIVAGVGSGLSWLAEFGLSKLARSIATPCLALACVLLTSCGSTPTGEKTFLGITGEGWANTGKAAAAAALPVAISEREKTAAKNPRNIHP